MGNILTKTFIRGVSGRPDIPGTPGTAPHPAFCIDVTRLVYGFRWVFIPDTGIDYGHEPPTSGGLAFYPVSVITEEVVHECTPASSGSPGTPGIPGTAPIAPDYDPGWDSGAISVPTVPPQSDYQFKFSIPYGVIGAVAGLSVHDVSPEYTGMLYGLYCASGMAQVWRPDAPLSERVPYIATDVFAIVRLGEAVTFFKNLTPIVTIIDRRGSVLTADAALYFGGDKIVDASLDLIVDSAFLPLMGTGAGLYLLGPAAQQYEIQQTITEGELASGTETPWQLVERAAGHRAGSAAAAASIEEIISTIGPTGAVLIGGLPRLLGTFWSADVAGGRRAGVLEGQLPGLSGSFTAPAPYQLRGSLPGLSGQFISADFVGSLTGRLPGLSGFFYDDSVLRPNYGVLSSSLPLVTGWFTGMQTSVGTLAGELPRLMGHFADYDYNGMNGVLPGLQGMFFSSDADDMLHRHEETIVLADEIFGSVSDDLEETIALFAEVEENEGYYIVETIVLSDAASTGGSFSNNSVSSINLSDGFTTGVSNSSSRKSD